MTARTRNEPPNLPIVALGLYLLGAALPVGVLFARDRKSTRLNSSHT